MRWLFNRRNSHLKKVKAGDNITIYCPRTFTVTIDKIKYSDQPISVRVVSNDIYRKKIWIKMETNNKSRYDFILKYSSDELSDFSLFNVYNKIVVNKTKEQLEKELQIAINSDNFEAAALINKKIKNIGD